MKINWTVRVKNPTFWIGLLGQIGSIVFAYMGITAADVTTWKGLLDIVTGIVSNPYLLLSVALGVVNFIGIVTDPTTRGAGDSDRALNYRKPN